jgi:glycerol-3-phosphate dehydrogenase
VSRLEGVQEQSFDVAVIGGGIVGCGVARDAALRGLRVVLFEKHDFASGTTAASTRIVHGGLRYLETADFRLVRMDLRERETLLRIASHLVKPLEFTIPLAGQSAWERLRLRTGLTLYDALAFDSSLSRHRTAGDEASYYDARVDAPERLAIENLVDAVAHGGRVLNYVEVTGAITDRGGIGGVRVRDRLTGGEAAVKARVTVNASGPWFEQVAGVVSPRPPGRIRMTKGIHLVCPPLTDRALVLFSKVDGRLMFAIPRLGHTWLGTTDTDYSGDPADAAAAREDVEYVVESMRGAFPSLSMDDVLYTTAGVRALVMQQGSASDVSRMHKVVDGALTGTPGLVSILGGKITGYRAIAEEATTAVCRNLGVRKRSVTAEEPLPGAQGSRTPREGVPPHLYDVYGSRAAAVAQTAAEHPDLGRRLSVRYPDIGAQVVFAVRHEFCVTVADFIRRRTTLGASADQGWDAAPAVASIMGEELGWSAEQRMREIEAYGRDVERTKAFRHDHGARAAAGSGGRHAR